MERLGLGTDLNLSAELADFHRTKSKSQEPRSYAMFFGGADLAAQNIQKRLRRNGLHSIKQEEWMII